MQYWATGGLPSPSSFQDVLTMPSKTTGGQPHDAESRMLSSAALLPVDVACCCVPWISHACLRLDWGESCLTSLHSLALWCVPQSALCHSSACIDWQADDQPHVGPQQHMCHHRNSHLKRSRVQGSSSDGEVPPRKRVKRHYGGHARLHSCQRLPVSPCCHCAYAV